MRLADFLAKRLRFLGIETGYMLTGGAAMHLNDAFSREYGENLHFLHHEQSCAMAAESYSRITNKPCFVNVTAGPGAINAANGVFGAFVDSIPMFVVSGQAKRETLAMNSGVDGLRQLGDQEANIVDIVKSFTKAARIIQHPSDIHDLVNSLYATAVTGRQGPVWLDVPIDIQSSELPDEFLSLLHQPLELGLFGEKVPNLDLVNLEEIAAHLLNDDRPVLYVGSGIRSAEAHQELLDFLDQWPIACVTGWNSNDLLWDNHPCYCGRPGTVGNRTGNFAVQFAGCLLTVGCRLNIRQISYNWEKFSPRSWKCHVDIDASELNKPTLSTDLRVCADAKGFFPALSSALHQSVHLAESGLDDIKQHWSDWRLWLKGNLETFSPTTDLSPISPGFVNPYRLIQKVSSILPEDSICVCSDGTACVVGFQSAVFKKGQRMFHNSGCASMGYELPAAIGAYHATKSTVTCLAGDGSIMMNIQELAIIGGKDYPIKIILINNNGYHSIRQTQENYFPDNIVGCSIESGLPFPDFATLSAAFGIPHLSISDESELQSALDAVYLTSGPYVLEVKIDQAQQFSPKLASRKLSDGSMISAELDDMSPHLPDDLLRKIRSDALRIRL